MYLSVGDVAVPEFRGFIAIVHDLRDAGCPQGDDRQSAGSRLQQHDPLRLDLRGGNKEMRKPVDLG